MIQQLTHRKCIAFLILLVTWWMSLDARAQRTTTRGTTAGARTGLGSTREYQNNSMIGNALISSDPETRRIIVITDDETAGHISQVITNLDRPKPQVLIKVVFLEVTYNKNRDVGVEASYTHHLGSNTGIVQTAFGLAAQSSGGFYRLLGDDLQVTLRAIAEAGTMEVLSRPSILARNNQLAVITVGNEVPFITSSRITDTGQTINVIDYRDIGIILRVTPFITSDGLVEMIVSPEISTLSERTVPISDTVFAPVIAKRAADTVVVTENGRTVVIGGLMETKQNQSVRKVPVLGDIPVLGWAFRRKITDNVKTELLIFLTPHVVGTPGELAQLSERETQQSQLPSSSFSEEELHKFLDGVAIRDKVSSPNSTPAKSNPGRSRNE